MKKTLYILSAVLLMMAACNKVETETVVPEAPEAAEVLEAPELRVNFTIGTGEDTKAVKSGWAEGDKVYVMFDNQVSLPDQYLTLTYTSGSWTANWTGGLANRLSKRTSGTLSAFFVPFQDSMHLSYNPSSTSPDYPRGTCWFIEPKLGGEKVYSDFRTSVNVPYSISGDVVTATFTLSLPSDYAFVHFFVPDLEQEVGRYTLVTEPAISGVTLTAYKPDYGFIAEYGDAELIGYPYAGGMSFVGVLPSSLKGVSTNYTFTLKDHSTVATDFGAPLVWSLSVTGKTLSRKSAIGLPATSSWMNATYGDATLRAVPMCEYGGQVLYFATLNIGATWPVGPESYGSHFQWAGTKPHPWAYEEHEFDDVLGQIPYYPDAPDGWGNPGGGGYNGDVTIPYYYQMNGTAPGYIKYLTGPKCALGYGDGWLESYHPGWYNQFIDNKTVLEPEDDAATANLGAPWRTPTREEWQALIDNCTWFYDSVNRGTKVSGKGAYEGNWIYLPEIRYDAYEHFDGRYMSATLFVHEDWTDGTGNSNIWALDFGGGPGKYLYNGFGRGNLLPIRAVRNSPL